MQQRPSAYRTNSTLSRRQADVSVGLPHRSQCGPIHLVVDATGLKVYGEGEWTVRQHGESKRRTWRKLHLGVDAATGQIVRAHADDPQRRRRLAG